ncbi:MAG: hypothetical protein ACRCTJ_05010 [Brevinema sp.]
MIFILHMIKFMFLTIPSAVLCVVLAMFLYRNALEVLQLFDNLKLTAFFSLRQVLPWIILFFCAVLQGLLAIKFLYQINYISLIKQKFKTYPILTVLISVLVFVILTLMTTFGLYMLFFFPSKHIDKETQLVFNLFKIFMLCSFTLSLINLYTKSK